MGTCLGFVGWFERPGPSIGESLNTAANTGGEFEAESAYLAVTREGHRQRCSEECTENLVFGHGDLLRAKWNHFQRASAAMSTASQRSFAKS